MPFADKEDLDPWVSGSELTVQIKNVKKSIFLPQTLSGCEIERAYFENRMLRVSFIKRGKK